MTDEVSRDPAAAHRAVPPKMSTMNASNDRESRRGRQQQFALVKHGARQSVEQYIDRLVELTRHHTLLPAEILDKRLRSERTRMESKMKRIKDITFSFQPIIAVSSIWYLRPICALLGIFFFGAGLVNLYSMVTLGVAPHRHYRLTALARRNATPHNDSRPPGPGVRGFGLFSRMDKEMAFLQKPAGKDMPAYSNITTNSMTISYPGQVQARSYDGWYIVTSSGSVDHDPTLLIIEGSDDEVTWEQVGSSSYANWGGTNILSNRTGDFCPLGRNQEVFFLARALWPAYFGYASTWIFTGVVFLFVFFSVISGSFGLIMLSIRFGTFSLSLSSIIAGVGYAVINIGDPVENHLSAIYFISAGVGYFICTVLLSSFPKYPDLFMIIFSVYAIVVNFILWDYTLSATTMALTIIALIGCLIFVSRLLAYSKAEKLIRKQRVIYDDIWIKVIDQPDAVRDLSVLNKVVRRISSATEGKTAAQFNLRIYKGSKKFGRPDSEQSSFISRQRAAMTGNRGSWMVAASIAEDLGAETGPLRSMDERPTLCLSSNVLTEFYGLWKRVFRPSLLQDLGNPSQTMDGFKANVVHGDSTKSDNGHSKSGRKKPAWVYEGLMSSIAEGRNIYKLDKNSPVTSLDQLYGQATLMIGLIRSLVCSLAMRCRGRLPVDVKDGDEEEGEKLVFSKLKSVDRCMAKIDGCYSGNISLLIDVCRERIVFDTIRDLTDCLMALSEEEAVEIVRIKSTMTSEGRDGQISSGFRFVSVNLRIQTEETVRLCINGHVCELQLVLLPFAQALTHHRHSQYISCRNSVNGVLSRAFGNVTRATIRGRKLSLQHRLNDIPDDPQKPKLDDVQEIPRWHTPVFDDGKTVMARIDHQLHTVTSNEISEGEADLADAPVSALSLSSTGQLDDNNAATTSVVPDLPQRRRGSLLRGNPRDERNGANFKRADGKWETSWGITVDRDMVDTLEALSRVVSLGFANVMDVNMSKTHNLGLESASASGMMFISRPITASSVRRFYQIVFSLAAIACIGRSILWKTGLPIAPLRRARHFEFRNILAKNGTRATWPGLDWFSVDDRPKTFGTEHEQTFLWRAIELESAPGTFDEDSYYSLPSSAIVRGPSIFVSYSEEIEACGWTLKGDIDSSNFEIYSSNSLVPQGGSVADIPTEDWQMLGTPSWGFKSILRVFDKAAPNMLALHVFAKNQEWHYDLPSPAEGESAELVFTPAWMADVATVLSDLDIITGLGFIFYSFFGLLRQASFARLCLMSFVFLGICTLLWGIGLNAGLSSFAPVLAIYLTSHLIFFLAILVERYFIYLSCLAGLVSLASHSLLALVGTQPVGAGYLTNQPGYMTSSYLPFIFFSFPVVVFILRVKALVTAKRLVMQDQKEYDKLWAEEIAKDEDGASINHLGEVVRMLGLDVASNQTYSSNMIQMDRKWVSRGKSHRNRRVIPSLERKHGEDHLFLEELQSYPMRMTIDPHSPVTSLDQLYMQAIVANVLLLDKVKVWAEHSNGYFQRRQEEKSDSAVEGAGGGEARFIKWIDVKDDISKQKMIKWSPIKRHQRCIEKLTRIYNSDVSKLVDISRHNIFFDSFADLTMCLGQIVTDLDVRVERVKSRLTVKYNADATAGYRDVALNIRALSGHACMLGCDTHMCEVQLILKSFGELRNAQGHERYVKFRDMRGE